MSVVNFSSRGRLRDKRERLWAKAELQIKTAESAAVLQELTNALIAEVRRRQAEANEASKAARMLGSEARELQVEIAQGEKEEATRHEI